ncbi:hypothetical protein GGX14DRAFT_397264 [Mycena pura]|uniref:CRIM domain-containing protein n=1 Tax=Mycena pura TaxID=153505 RepID=A0AAD6VCG0_9AGAR|nr:hypothetical protein GGX14DRAFT_397264 [Mycena pura]
MFSVKPPRRATVPAPNVSQAGSSSSDRSDNFIQFNEDDFSYRRSAIARSSYGGGWSPSCTTLKDGSPRYSRSASARQSLQTSVAPAFACEVPEDPLRAAMSLESVIDPSHLAVGTGSEGVAYSLLSFSRREVRAIQPHASALTAAMAQRPNPFDAAVAGVGEGPLQVRVCFPHAAQPAEQLLALALPASATVEDAIARALWTYWERGWLPALDLDEARDTDLSEWVMLVRGTDGVMNKRIARTKMEHYDFDVYAIVRKPKTNTEKRKIQMQIANFRLLSPPPASLQQQNDKRHNRQCSLPTLAFKSGSLSKSVKGPMSFSKLPCQCPHGSVFRLLAGLKYAYVQRRGFETK